MDKNYENNDDGDKDNVLFKHELFSHLKKIAMGSFGNNVKYFKLQFFSKE